MNGSFRKLVLVKEYSSLRKDWHEAPAFVLREMPIELVFLFEDVFRCERAEMLAWLINIGHGLVGDLLESVKPARSEPAGRANGPERAVLCDCVEGERRFAWLERNKTGQLGLEAIPGDDVAMPILERAANLESSVEAVDEENVLVRYRGITFGRD